MASTHKSLRSGTANKRPTTSIADGQIALNTNTTSPGLFFKDSTGATIIKVGPVHVGTTAPNASPAAGGSAGNSVGEIWLDTSLTPVGVKIWNGSAFVNATPIGSTTVQGLLELATNAETQTGTDPDRAVTPAGLQSKVSDSTSTTSSTTIASSTAVKSAYDLANAALPKSGGTVTGNLEIGTTGSLSFEGATADAFETTIAVVDPTADRTITLPDTTGTVVTTGDTGTVTSTMIADGTIVNGDINASAAIDHSKLANITAGSVLLGNASNVPTATALSGDVTVNSTGVTAISSGVIVNADVNASAAIAGTKISPDFGSQTITTTGVVSAALGAAATPSLTFTGDLNTGIYSPGADQVAISTGGSGRLFIDSSGNVLVNTSTSPTATIKLLVNGNAGVSSGSYLSFRGEFGNTTEPAAQAIKYDSGLTGLQYYGYGGHAYFAGGSERMRLDSSGRLGIGTSSPDNKLSVGIASADEGVELKATYNGARVARFGLVNPGVDNTPYIGSVTGNDLGFITSNTRRMTLDASGRLGIGTTTVDSLLHLKGTGTAYSGSVAVGPVLTLEDTAGRIAQLVAPGSVGEAGVGTKTSHVFTFFTANTEKARIDQSGRLLVGTSTAYSDYYGSSSAWTGIFQVARNANDAVAQFSNWNSTASASNGGTQLYLSACKSGAIGTHTGGALANGDSIGSIIFNASDGSNFRTAAWIQAAIDGTPGTADVPGRLVFSTTADGASSPTERMRIGQNGSVQIGRTTGQIDTELFTVQNGGQCGWIYQTANSNVVALTMRHTYAQSAQTAKMISFLQSNGAEVGAITSTTTATAYGTSSDYRLKENVASVTDGIARLQQLKPSRFNFIADPDKTVDGFIAHEVQAIVPEAIIGEKDAVDDEGNPVYQGIDQSKLVPLLTAALQEAIGEIESLKARLTAAGI